MRQIKNLKPLGHRVYIKPDPIEHQSKGGIYIPDPIAKTDQETQHQGTVVDIGNTCWADTPGGVPWCKVGDRVLFEKHHGRKIWDVSIGKYRDDILLINDLDLIALITEEEEV